MTDRPGLVSLPVQPRVEQEVGTGRRRRRPSGEPPPLPRQLARSGRYWVALLGCVVLGWAVAGVTRRTGTVVDRIDHGVLTGLAGIRTPWLTRAAEGLDLAATSWTLRAMWWASLLVLVVFRKWRHFLVWVLVMAVVSGTAAAAVTAIRRPRPLDIEIIGTWHGFAMPSRPVAVLAATLVAALYALVPQGRPREVGKYAVTGVLAFVALARLYLGVEGPADVLAGAILGVTVPLVGFRLLTPNEIFPVTYRRGRTAHVDVSGRRGEAIVRALRDQIGVVAAEVRPFALAGSGGSTPLRVTVRGEPDSYLFCKLYTAVHLRSDRWYKLGRTLFYGRLEDETGFGTVRRLVQYEDYALRVLRDAGLPVPKAHGVVEITPEREYLLVMEFFDGAVEIDAHGRPTEAMIDQALTIVRRLWDSGLAHRDIKPANLLVRDGRVLLIDSAFTEVRPTPWRQAVDLANMMLVLALHDDVEHVYRRALQYFTVDEVCEAMAATRGLAMPSQLRRLIRQQGRDLHGEFVKLLPNRPRPIVIQRWSIRRVLLWLAVLGMTFVAVQLGSVLVSGPL